MKLLVLSLLIGAMVVLTSTASVDLGPLLETFLDQLVKSNNSTYGVAWKEYGSRSFIHVKLLATWLKAKETCERIGGNLATIQNKEEETFVQQMIKKAKPWIGFTDEEEEGQWVSTDGEPMKYTNWCQSYLTNVKHPTRNCAMMMKLSSRTCFHDVSCKKRRSFVCSKTVE